MLPNFFLRPHGGARAPSAPLTTPMHNTYEFLLQGLKCSLSLTLGTCISLYEYFHISEKLFCYSVVRIDVVPINI